jgi:hypothetical protein
MSTSLLDEVMDHVHLSLLDEVIDHVYRRVFFLKVKFLIIFSQFCDSKTLANFSNFSKFGQISHFKNTFVKKIPIS